MSERIKSYTKYGNPREIAKRDPYVHDSQPHGMSPGNIEQLHEKMSALEPSLVNLGRASHNILDDILPEGATPSLKRTAQISGTSISGFGQSTIVSPTRPYQPEFASQDRQCFVEGTQVTLADGTRRKIEDIRVGDRVLDGKGHVATIEAAWCEGVPEELVELRVWGGRKFLCTPNHRWPVWTWLRNCSCGCGEAIREPGKCYINHHHPTPSKDTPSKIRSVFGTRGNRQSIPVDYEPVHKVEAATIKSGDLLLMPRKFDAIRPKGVTEDHALLLGYYIAEGCPQNKGYSTKFALHKDERHTLAADIAAICARFGVGTYMYDELSCNGMTVITLSDIRKGGPGKARDLNQWLTGHAGVGSSTKRLSEEVMQWPVSLKRQIIRGAFLGDGCQRIRSVNKKKGDSLVVSYITTSPMLAAQLTTILTQIGFPCRTYSKAAFVDSTGSKHKRNYTIELNGEPAQKLSELVWREASRVKELEELRAIRKRKITFHGQMTDDDFIYVKVKSVTVLKNSAKLRVFNLSVSGDHSYLVENIATFNSFPIHRLLANRYWRLFAKVDAFTQTFINMLADLVWSQFQLVGEGVDGEVKRLMEAAIEETQLHSMLSWLVREYLVLGEACPHLFFDQAKGIWTHVTFLNPDQLEVIYTPFIKMEPIVEFVPDDRLRQCVTSSHPMLRRVREAMPPELVARLSARQNLPLSPVNFTFIPRKQHPYDVRGSSMLAPLWRVYMIEDALAESLIATARRASRPIKALKLGTPDGTWIPNESYERKLLGLMAQAELDSEAYVAVHYGVNFELWGDPQRAINLANQFDLIERWKLVAFGVNKAFVLGEASYSSAAAGLTTFLQRLKSLREYFESVWLRPKFFGTLARINKWIKPKPAEVSGSGPWVRTKRSASDLLDSDRYITPRIEWEKTLDPTANTERLGALAQLEQLGVKVSKKTKLATVGLDYIEELKQIKKEVEEAKKIVGKDIELAAATGVTIPGMAPPVSPESGGAGGPMISPGLPPGALTGPGLGGDTGDMGSSPPSDMGAPTGGDTVPLSPGASKAGEEGHKDEPRVDGWDQSVVRGALVLFKDMDHADPDMLGDPWTDMMVQSKEIQEALRMNDKELLWQTVEDELIQEGFPTRQITNLQDVLVTKGLLPKQAGLDSISLDKIEAQLAEITKGLSNGTDFYVGAKGKA